MKKLLLILFLIGGLKSYSCNVYDTINQTICPEDSFLFNGVYLKTAGVYYDTFNISPGCDTFRTLNLSVHATIPLTPLVDSFCPGYPYSFHSKTYAIAGNYYDTLNSVNGCDSVIFLNLTYKANSISVEPSVDTFCIRDTIDFRGKKFKYTTGGNKTMRDTVFAAGANGCDSIYIRLVFLRNNNGPNFVGTKYGCTNVPFVIGDSVFTTNGFKTAVLRNRFGCDSTIWFNLQRRPPSPPTTLNRTICANQPYLFYGQYYTATSINDTTLPPIVYVDIQKANAPGFGTQKCDSVVTLNLTVYPVKATLIDTSLCENHSFFFKGQFRKNPGVYVDSLQTIHGCDSVVTLILRTPRKTSSYTYYRKYCSNESVFFNNTNIDQPGTYRDTLVNAVGCDSFLTMVLTKDTAHNVILNKSICSYDSFYFDGKYYVTAGTYTATFKNKHGCDSIVILNLSTYPFRTVTVVRSTLNNIKADSGYLAYYWYFNDWKQLNVTGHILAANTTGSYFVIAQDSNNCRFKSNVYVHNPAEIQVSSGDGIKVYPVPSSDILNIESNSIFDKNTTIQLYNLEGKLVLTQSVLSKSNRLLFNISSIAKGNYILQIQSGNKIVERRIEKQ